MKWSYLQLPQPAVPRIVEQFEVITVVGQEQTVAFGGHEEVFVISRTLQAEIARRDGGVAATAEQGDQVKRDILVRVEFSHREGGYSANSAAFRASRASIRY